MRRKVLQRLSLTARLIGNQTPIGTYRETGGRMDGQTDGRTDGWMDGRTDRWTEFLPILQYLVFYFFV